jgi:hypothetical protein
LLAQMRSVYEKFNFRTVLSVQECSKGGTEGFPGACMPGLQRLYSRSCYHLSHPPRSFCFLTSFSHRVLCFFSWAVLKPPFFYLFLPRGITGTNNYPQPICGDEVVNGAGRSVIRRSWFLCSKWKNPSRARGWGEVG